MAGLLAVRDGAFSLSILSKVKQIGTLVLTPATVGSIISTMETGLLRLVDANANRAREGLRVAEDLARLILCDESIALRLKELRHRVTELSASLADERAQLEERSSEDDLGRRPGFDTGREEPGNTASLVRRNMRRSEEACRVLEEVSLLLNGSLRVRFKELRYSMYDLEKALVERL